MFKVKMKPETIARRKQERIDATLNRKIELKRRLTEKAIEKPESIFPELLAEFITNNPNI